MKRRRAERDRRLAEIEEERGAPLGAEAADSSGELGPDESVLDRMRASEGDDLNPVHAREQEQEAEQERIRSRAQRGLAGVLAALVLALVAYLLVLDQPAYEVTASFQNASQLVEGNEAKIGGTAVGKISSIELGDDGEALVTFTVNEDFTPLRRGTTATVRSFSLSGQANRFVQLTLPPEERAGEEIPDGGSLSQAETVSEVDLDELFNTLDDETVADLKKVIRGFEISYEGVGKQANRGFRYLNPFLSTSRRLFSELSLDERALERLIVDGAQLSGTLASKRDDVSALIGNLNQMMGALGRQRTSLASAVNQLPSFLRETNTTFVNLRATLDDVDPLVNASKPVAKKLQPFFAEFRAAAANLVPTISDLDRIIKRKGSANDLVDLNRLQPPLAKIALGKVRRNGKLRDGAFPESVRSLEDGLTQLSFFRAYTPELVGWFNDFGATSGIYDANGAIPRIGTTFNTFTLSPNGLPLISAPQGPEQVKESLNFGNLERCPGSNERPAPDGSNPYTEGGELDCDPSQVPPGP